MNESVQPITVRVTRFDRVKEILDEAVDGEEFGAHGPFWRGQNKDEFVANIIFGFPLLVVGDGAGSNIVKALRGEGLFNSSPFRRMPAGRDPVAPENIEFIRQWIDEGCPEDLFVEEGQALLAADSVVDPAIHIVYWRDFDDWAMFQVSPAIGQAIGTFFGGAAIQWMQYARDETLEPAWDSAIQQADVQAAIGALATRQMQTVRSHYGDPINWTAVLDAYEHFGDNSLPDDPLRPADPRHSMNGPEMWFFWSAFADACLRLGIEPDVWRNEIRAILLGMLNDGLFRGRFPVNGFSADEAGKQAMRDHVRTLPDDQLQAELRRRYADTNFGTPP